MPGSSLVSLYSSPEPALSALDESPPSPALNDYILAPHESESTDLVARTSYFLYKRDQVLASPKVQGLVQVNSQTLIRLIQTLKLQGIRTSMDTKGIASISFSCRQNSKASGPLDPSACNNGATVFYPIGTSTVHDLLFLSGSGTPDISRELTAFQSGPEQTPISDWLVVSEGAAPGVYSSQTLKSYSIPDFAIKTVKVEEGRLRNALYCYKEKAFRHHLYVNDPLVEILGWNYNGIRGRFDSRASRRDGNSLFGPAVSKILKMFAFDSLLLPRRHHPGIVQLQTMARVAAEITPSAMRSLLVMLGSARMTTDFVAPAEDVLGQFLFDSFSSESAEPKMAETVTFYCDEQWDESDLRVDRLVESALSDSAFSGPVPLDIHFSYIGSSSDEGQIRMSVQNVRPFTPPPEPLAPSSAVILRRDWHAKSCQRNWYVVERGSSTGVYHGWRSIAPLVKATNSAWSHWTTEEDAIERFILLCYSSELVVLRNSGAQYLFLGYDINDEEAWKATKEKTVVLME
ncbi:hypothetical protein C8J56DRAFT_1062718 [Mycena floridula]|nr:hypothetical protein C8J56DRAFT_1062718 [Mycena floridula]